MVQSLQARGGADRFAAISSLRITGRIRFAQGAFGPISVLAQQPSSFRAELTIGPDQIIQTYDGVTGWQSITGTHAEAAHALTGPQLDQVIDQAVNAIGGPLVKTQSRGTLVALAGTETVDGKPCYKLKLTFRTGTTMYQYIDKTSKLEIKEELLTKAQGKPLTIRESVSDYRTFGGLLFPCLFISHDDDGSESERLEIQNVEINPKIDASLFRLSKPGPA